MQNKYDQDWSPQSIWKNRKRCYYPRIQTAFTQRVRKVSVDCGVNGKCLARRASLKRWNNCMKKDEPRCCNPDNEKGKHEKGSRVESRRQDVRRFK